MLSLLKRLKNQLLPDCPFTIILFIISSLISTRIKALKYLKRYTFVSQGLLSVRLNSDPLC